MVSRIRLLCVIPLCGLGCLPTQELDSYRRAESAAEDNRAVPLRAEESSSTADGDSVEASTSGAAQRDAGAQVPDRTVEAPGDSLVRDSAQGQQANGQLLSDPSDAGGGLTSEPLSDEGAVPPAQGLDSECADGIVSVDGSKCYVSPMQLASWPDALNRCVALGGTLARVESLGDDGRIGGLVTANAWLGASDTAQDGSLVWTDGTPVTFGNWGPGQPDEFPGQDCIEKRLEILRRWYDQPCDNLRRFVCELPLP